MNILDFMTVNKIKGIISITAAVVMYFTPEEVDHIIEGLLSAFGITSLFISDKKEK